MNFSSDNSAGVAPQIMAALSAANKGSAMAYGEDAITQKTETAFSDLFEKELAIFPVATGTAANALSLSALTPPWGQILCHRNAHIEEDEAGAPEMFTGGAKLSLLEGSHGKISLKALKKLLSKANFGVQHHSQPKVLSLTQATEAGTIYQNKEISDLADIAHQANLAVHMDGARFANALATLGCSPAEATWKIGVDVLSFGATKNGAMAAEAVVFFDPQNANEFLFRRKQGGHLFSKMRYLSAQLLAYLQDDLWIKNARHANRCALELSKGLENLEGCELLHEVQANEVFVQLSEQTLRALENAGAGSLRWDKNGTARFVCAFDTNMKDVDRILEIVGEAA